MLLFAATPAVQAQDNLALAAVATVRHAEVVHQGPFVAGLVPITRQQHAVALLASGRLLDTRFRLRASAAEERSDTAVRSSSGKVRLMELARSFAVGENGILTLGKTAINWDVGQAMQPVGFFERQADLVDGEDFEGRVEGLPLLAMAWLSETHSLTLAYASEHDRSTGQRAERWGVNAGWATQGLSAALVLHKAAGQPPGLGGTLAWTASERSVVHASAYADGKLRAVAGLTHATDAHNSWIAEVNLDGHALASTDWERWRSRLQAHRQQHLQQPSARSSADLLDDIQQLGATSVGRSRLYLQWRHQQEDWSLMPQLLAGSDGSVLWNLTVAWRWRGVLSVEGAWTRLGGGAASYHAQLPWRSRAWLGLKASF
jgi:hypothetical protein